jgi:hypothetical protein
MAHARRRAFISLLGGAAAAFIPFGAFFNEKSRSADRLRSTPATEGD